MSGEFTDFDLEKFLPYQMTVIAERMSSELANQYQSRYAITTAQWRVILNIGFLGSASVRDIEKRVSLEKSNICRAAARLEEQGYLTKQVDEIDRRLIKLQLTPKGKKLWRELIALAAAYQENLEAKLGAKFDELQSALSIFAQEKSS